MDEQDEIPPDLANAITETANLSRECLEANSDNVTTWLCGQWIFTMTILPDTTLQARTKDLLLHLGAISLTLERVGFTEYQPFQHVAAELLRRFDACNAPDSVSTPDVPSGTIH